MELLETFRFCPGCGREGIAVVNGKSIACSACGFEYFHNVAAAAGIIIHDDRCILTVERSMDPCRGMLGLPGGFLDKDESAEEGALRECAEETGIELTLKDLGFVSSSPNLYSYKGLDYRTCDIIFEAYIQRIPTNLKPRDNEALSITAIPFNELDVSRFAFPSIRDILARWLKKKQP